MTNHQETKIAFLVGFSACLVVPFTARALETNGNVTVVASKVDGGYNRGRLPDGSLQPEYYAYAEGGRWTGGIRDGTIDRMHFIDVARTIARPLAAQSFFPATDAKSTKLLIVVYWGRTSTPERAEDSVATQDLQHASAAAADAKSKASQQDLANSTVVTPPVGNTVMCFRPSNDVPTDTTDADNAFSGALAMVAAENRSRDQLDAQNAALLGYDSLWNATSALQGTPLEQRRQDVADELEHDRYFVVLMAYDFQKMWKLKKHELLWETRFSVRQRGVAFDQQLSEMAQDASHFFGKDTHGLVRMELPTGRVDVGALKSLGAVAAK